MTAEKIGVVVRSLNEAKHLRKLSYGLKNQTIKISDLVLVDSGSTDGTQQIAEELGFRVVNLPKEKFTYGRSLNVGFDNIRADIVVSLSAHVFPKRTDFLEHLTKQFVDPKTGMVYGRQIGDLYSSYSERRLMFDWFPPEQKNISDSIAFSNNANSATRKIVWEQYKFDESVPGLEDVEFANRILRDGHLTAYSPEAVIVHLHRQNFKKVVDRYRKEAFALRSFLPNARLAAHESIYLAYTHIMRDLLAAASEKEFARQFSDILSFRTAQFFGAWQGGREKSAESRLLVEEIYHPRKNNKSDVRATGEDEEIAYPDWTTREDL